MGKVRKLGVEGKSNGDAKSRPKKKNCHDGELRKCAIFSIGPPALVRSNGDVPLQHYR